MFCNNCGKQIPEGTKVCPYCNAHLMNNLNKTSGHGYVHTTGQNSPKPKKPKYSNNKKPKLLVTIVSLILSVTMLVPLVLSTLHTFVQAEPKASDEKKEAKVEIQSSGEIEYETDKIEKSLPDTSQLQNVSPNTQGSQKVREEIAVVESAIATAESEILVEDSVLNTETVGDYINAVSNAMRELENNNLIKDYYVNSDNIRIELNFGGNYIYAPVIEGLDAGSVPELTVATYQPYYSEGQYENVMDVKDYPDDGAKLIMDAFDAYVFNSGGDEDTDFNDDEVNPHHCAEFGKHNVVLWHGHGTYDNTFGPLMGIGIARTDETDAKFHDMLMSNTMLYTKSTYFIGADFVEAYVEEGSLDKTVLYLGVCKGGYNDKLAKALLNKGAEAVYSPSHSILTKYNANMIRSVCEGLTKQNSDGTYYNVEQALTYAQNVNGKTDNGPHNAEIKLFTGNPSFSLDWYNDYVVAERDVVLALDISGSMSGTPLNETKEAAIEFVNTVLDEDARIGIVTYDTEAEMISDFSTKKQQLIDSISNLNTKGATNIDAALQIAENMLGSSKAKKKIIVLMSDGIPNEDRQGKELVKYAQTIKNQDVYIYTLGFFSDLDSYSRAEAQSLLDGIATEGHHYEVTSAEDLVYFFGDMADTISGQKYIYIEIACPVDVKVSKDGETLNSSENKLQTRTSFGTLSFEENAKEDDGEGNMNISNNKETDSDDLIKILRLKDGMEYDIEISGTGAGKMDYTVQYMDENGDYSDKRKFNNVPIKRSTEITTVASATRAETILSVDEDGDGRYDVMYKAKTNDSGKEYKNPLKILLMLLGIDLLWIVLTVLVLVLKVKKIRYLKTIA